MVALNQPHTRSNLGISSKQPEIYIHDIKAETEDDCCSKIQTAVRITGFQAPVQFIRDRVCQHEGEQKQIAIFKSRSIALISTLTIHLLPVSGVIALAVLNYRGYFVGNDLQGQGTQEQMKLLALQFAAKLHELLILMSIAAVISSLVVVELTNGNGLPLGALAAGLQARNFSFLWSREIVSIAKWGIKTRSFQRLGFLVILIASILLGVAVGPATGFVTKPRDKFWPSGGSVFYMQTWTSDPLTWPTTINALGVDVGSCNATACWPASQNAAIQNYLQSWGANTMPEQFQILGEKAWLTASISTRQRLPDGTRTDNNFTIATMQSANIAERIADLSRLWDEAASISLERRETRLGKRRSAKYSIEAQMPVAHSRCHSTLLPALGDGHSSINLTSSEHKYSWANATPAFPNLGDIEMRPKEYLGSNLLNIFQGRRGAGLNVSELQSRPSLVWMNVPHKFSGEVSALAIAIFPVNVWTPGYEPNRTNLDMAVVTCAVDARWASGITYSTSSSANIMQGTPDFKIRATGADLMKTWLFDDHDWRRITIGTNFSSLTNPINPPVGGSQLFQLYTDSAGLKSEDGLINLAEVSFDQFAPRVESILALMTINGLSRLNIAADPMGAIKNYPDGPWYRGFMPSQGTYSGIGTAYNVSDLVRAYYPNMTFKVESQGFGYGADAPAVHIAMSILLVYTLLVVCNVASLIGTGVSSTSWDTFGEVITLALLSKPPAALENTSAGISSYRTFESIVKIASINDHLELSFAKEEQREVGRVKYNVKY